MGRDGYVVRERVFDADECAAITTACESLVDELVTHRRAERTRYHIGSYTFDPDWDYPYWNGYADEPHNKVTAMLFLDDAALANGTLQVLPGSHALGRARTRTDKDEFGNNELDPTEAEGRRPTPVEVPTGSVVWFGPFMIHKSEPNTSDRERRSLLFTYQPARCRTGLAVFEQQFARRQAQTDT